MMPTPDINSTYDLCFNRLLKLHHDANCGHLGGNLSCLHLLVYLYHIRMTNEDVFVMSKGHAAGALYVVLWSLGLLSDSDLITFHKNGTHLCSHASEKHNIFSTGSLGHGLSLATGMAIGRKLRGEPGTVYCLLSDGELQEGQTQEALWFIRRNHVENLIVMIDGNGWQGFGREDEIADVSPPVRWNGHSFKSIDNAFEHNTGVNIKSFRTVKGYGTSLADTLESHYLPLSQEAYETSLRKLVDCTV